VYDLPKQTAAEKITALKWSFAVQMFYHPLMCSIRASIIMFLFRMKDNRRRIRISLHIVCKLPSTSPSSTCPVTDLERTSLAERRVLHSDFASQHSAV
jgi:hypothetical protein